MINRAIEVLPSDNGKEGVAELLEVIDVPNSVIPFPRKEKSFLFQLGINQKYHKYIQTHLQSCFFDLGLISSLNIIN